MHELRTSTPSAALVESQRAMQGLRERLLARVARSADAARAFVTVRASRCGGRPLAAGVRAWDLYQAAGSVRRRGEPQRVRIVEFDPGTGWTWPDDATGTRRELLVLRGDLLVAGRALAPRDYLVAPAGLALGPMASVGGVRAYCRESPADPQPGQAIVAVHDADAGWADHVPGIQRRVLWQQGGEAALLYLARPGAAVPRHGHGHDEECLMVEGDVFLDDLLLRAGDWQLAPSGTHHEGVSTDTGGVLYAHGDLDLAVDID